LGTRLTEQFHGKAGPDAAGGVAQEQPSPKAGTTVEPGAAAATPEATAPAGDRTGPEDYGKAEEPPAESAPTEQPITNTDPALDAAIRAKMEPEGEPTAPPPGQEPAAPAAPGQPAQPPAAAQAAIANSKGFSVRWNPDEFQFEAVSKDGKVIGHLLDAMPEKGTPENPAFTAGAEVDEPWRRKGVASALYDAFAAKHDGNIAPAGNTSREAWDFWLKKYPDKTADYVKQQAADIAANARSGNFDPEAFTDQSIRNNYDHPKIQDMIIKELRSAAPAAPSVAAEQQAQPATPREAIEQRAPGETVGDILRQPASLGAAATGEVPSAGAPPTSPPGALTSTIRAASDKLFDIGRDIQMKVAPMATGTRDSMAAAKDFANGMRGIDHDWSLTDTKLERGFTPEQRKRMWDANDEESVMQQRGEANEHMGLATLTPEERAGIAEPQADAAATWKQAYDAGIVKSETGLPNYTPRMMINAATGETGPRALDRIGGNLRTTTPQLRQRKYQTAEETEAAAKARLGEQAELARDIRTLPLATAQLKKAIAGRTLINNIKEIGKRTGQETVAEGTKPGPGWFTIDHPAFYSWRPKMEEADTATYRAAAEQRSGIEVPPAKIPLLDRNGETVWDKVPLYVRGDFEGPLRSVLTKPSGAAYSQLMNLKGKTMGLIMNSPLIHNAVEWGRALPAMPGKVATFKVYFEGNRAKNDPATMREAIDNGLVPIGKRFFNQDISSIMEQPNLTPGRSWTSQVLGFVPGLFSPAKGVTVKQAIDRAGDFWHNTLLWDRVGDLQMGLYTNFRDDLTAKGIDPQSSARIAAHWANRYAGALPQEAMSDAARKISNMLLFSRSFTLGNLGAMKDMLNGMPRDVRAQISRDVGNLNPQAEGYIKSLAQRKAVSIIMLDMGLMYLGNSLLQSGLNVMKGDKTLGEEGQGYADRLSAALQRVRDHPLSLLQPLDLAQSLSSTAEHEPGKQDRILVGHTKDGTAIYARNPVGKIGEEFTGYLSGPLDMLRRKLGTIARPVWQVLANDKGFGRKVYDPNADTPEKYLKNAGAIASHFATSQIPEIQLSSAADLATGQGDRTLALAQTFGPIAGVTFSKGAPGGPDQGVLYNLQAQERFAQAEAMPEIRKMIQSGDIPGAYQRMRELNIKPGLQQFYVRSTLNPAARFSPKAIQQILRGATPEQRERFQRARGLQPSP
jgi:GNAT superfamily N-acetyltransferase